MLYFFLYIILNVGISVVSKDEMGWDGLWRSVINGG